MAHRPLRLDLDTVRWLAGRAGDAADLDWRRLEAEADAIFPPLLPHLLTGAESDAIDDPERSSRELIDVVRGGQTSLAWLAGALRRATTPRVGRAWWQALDLPLRVRRAPWPDVLLPAGPPRRVLRDASPARARLVMSAARRVGLARPEWLPEAIHGNPGDVLEYGLGGDRWVALWFRRAARRRPVAASWAGLRIEHGRPTAAAAGTALPLGITMDLWPEASRAPEARSVAADLRSALDRLCPDAPVTVRLRGRPIPVGGGGGGFPEDRLAGWATRAGRRVPVRGRRTALITVGGGPRGEARWTRRQVRAAAPFEVLLAGLGDGARLAAGRRRALAELALRKGSLRESEYLRQAVRCRWFFDAISLAVGDGDG